MAQSRTQMMVDRLRELQASSPDIEASAIVSVDGLTIASALPQGVEEDRVSAMSAAMLSLGERIAGELGRGSFVGVSEGHDRRTIPCDGRFGCAAGHNTDGGGTDGDGVGARIGERRNGGND